MKTNLFYVWLLYEKIEHIKWLKGVKNGTKRKLQISFSFFFKFYS